MLASQTLAIAVYVSLLESVLGRERPPELTVRAQPLVMIEHVSLNIPEYNDTYRNFWMDTLGCVSDPTAELNKDEAGINGLVWANIGLQQIRMPMGELEPAQVLRGHLGLDFPDTSKLQKKLKKAKIEYRWGRALHRQLGIAADHLEFTDPQGNHIRAYEQDKMVVVAKLKPVWYGPSAYLSTDHTPEVGLPGGKSVGRGIRYVEFETPKGAAPIICKTYKKHFRHKELYEEKGMCEVPIGFHQYLRYKEIEDAVPKYDGHRIGLYINKFIESYKSFKADNLIYSNPRFPQLKFDTLNDALDHNEFRFKDFVDEKTGEVVYTLEHVIRSLAHKEFACSSMIPDEDPKTKKSKVKDAPLKPAKIIGEPEEL